MEGGDVEGSRRGCVLSPGMFILFVLFVLLTVNYFIAFIRSKGTEGLSEGNDDHNGPKRHISRRLGH
jgi:hypothetical protein